MADQDLHRPTDAPTDPAGPSPQTAPPQTAPPQTAPPPTAPPQAVPARPPLPRTRLGGAWVALAGGAVVLLLLLIFILENSQSVDIAYFGAHGHLPLGVALLLAAVAGILLVAIPVAGRIFQLRRTARRRHKNPPAAAPQQQTGPQK